LFQAFFADAKQEKSWDFQDFAGSHRYDSFCYPQSGFTLLGKEIFLSKIGRIRVKIIPKNDEPRVMQEVYS